MSFGNTPTFFLSFQGSQFHPRLLTLRTVGLTPAFLITSMHFSKDFIFSSGVLDVTNISTGILPPFKGSRCLAANKMCLSVIEAMLNSYLMKELTFLRGSHHIHHLRRKNKKRSGKFIAKEPELFMMAGEPTRIGLRGNERHTCIALFF